MSATELPHLYAGELQFRRYSDSSTQGPQVVFGLADREALQAFVGIEGRRVMAVLVLVGDDEQPEPPKVSKPLKEGPRRKLGPICLWLVERCKEPEFQLWAANREGLPMPTEAIAADFCRRACEVESRKDIDGDAAAEALFRRRILRPWEQHCDRQALSSLVSRRVAQPT